MLQGTFSGEMGIFPHFPLPGKCVSPLICITMLLIPEYPVSSLFFYVYFKPVNIAILIFYVTHMYEIKQNELALW